MSILMDALKQQAPAAARSRIFGVTWLLRWL